MALPKNKIILLMMIVVIVVFIGGKHFIQKASSDCADGVPYACGTSASPLFCDQFCPDCNSVTGTPVGGSYTWCADMSGGIG